MKAAWPGVILMAAAVVCLVLATVSTPIIKSLYFLQADVSSSTVNLGCLGYCINGQCSATTLGYSFDPNSIFGIDQRIPSRYTSAVIKGLTYTLVLHPVAAAAALLALVIGSFSLCRTRGGCCAGIFGSLATALAAVAFGLDLALFIIAKKRIENLGGSASFGAALWLTLAAWILLFVSSCAFTCNGCCGGSGRKEGRRNKKGDDDFGGGGYGKGYDGGYGDRMRMDAIQAEADRKRRQDREGELPKFAEYETVHEVPVTEPLRHDYEDQYHSRPAGRHPVAPSAYDYGAGYGAYDPYGGGGAQQPGYGYDYGPSQAHHGYGNVAPAAAAAAGATYVAGVGPGQRRVNRGDSMASTPNIAGYGAHAAGVAPGTPTRPARPDDDMLYSPGEGPQPFRDGSMMDVAGGVGAASSQHGGDPYGGSYSQQQHGMEPSSATFGHQEAHQRAVQQAVVQQHPDVGQQQQHGGNNDDAYDYQGYDDGQAYLDEQGAYRTTSPGVMSHHEAHQQAIAAALGQSGYQPQQPQQQQQGQQGSRALPATPVARQDTDGGASVGSPHTRQWNAVGSAGDDGFGLAVLQAGQRAAEEQRLREGQHHQEGGEAIPVHPTRYQGYEGYEGYGAAGAQESTNQHHHDEGASYPSHGPPGYEDYNSPAAIEARRAEKH